MTSGGFPPNSLGRVRACYFIQGILSRPWYLLLPPSLSLSLCLPSRRLPLSLLSLFLSVSLAQLPPSPSPDTLSLPPPSTMQRVEEEIREQMTLVDGLLQRLKALPEPHRSNYLTVAAQQCFLLVLPFLQRQNQHQQHGPQRPVGPDPSSTAASAAASTTGAAPEPPSSSSAYTTATAHHSNSTTPASIALLPGRMDPRIARFTKEIRILEPLGGGAVSGNGGNRTTTPMVTPATRLRNPRQNHLSPDEKRRRLNGHLAAHLRQLD